MGDYADLEMTEEEIFDEMMEGMVLDIENILDIELSDDEAEEMKSALGDYF